LAEELFPRAVCRLITHACSLQGFLQSKMGSRATKTHKRSRRVTNFLPQCRQLQRKFKPAFELGKFAMVCAIPFGRVFASCRGMTKKILVIFFWLGFFPSVFAQTWQTGPGAPSTYPLVFVAAENGCVANNTGGVTCSGRYGTDVLEVA